MLSFAKRTRLRAIGAAGIAALVAACTLDTSAGVWVISIVSGSPQTVKVGAVAQPLTVRVFDVDGLGLSDVDVDWVVVANAGSVSPARTVTDDTGQTSATYTAPSTPGNVQIQATAEGLTVTFNLVVEALSGT